MAQDRDAASDFIASPSDVVTGNSCSATVRTECSRQHAKHCRLSRTVPARNHDRLPPWNREGDVDQSPPSPVTAREGTDFDGVGELPEIGTHVPVLTRAHSLRERLTTDCDGQHLTELPKLPVAQRPGVRWFARTHDGTVRPYGRIPAFLGTGVPRRTCEPCLRLSCTQLA